MELKKYLARILLSVFVLPLILSNASSARSSTEIKKLPPLRQARARTIDVKHIALDLRFDWAKKQAFGTAAITFAPLASADKFALDAAFLTINSISLGGKALKFDYDGGDKNDNLKIALDRVYSPKEDVAVKIVYRTNWTNQPDPNSLGGSDGKGLRFNEPTSNDPTKIREIWSFGEPEANRYWFPGYDAPDDWRTTEFTATVDKNLTVISNGKLVETKDNADGTRIFHYKASAPYPNHLTAFAAGEFVNVRKNYESVELNNFGYLREKDAVDASTGRLPDMVGFFSEKLGAKFPFQSYSQVFVQDIGSFTGRSNLNFSTITENMIDDFPTHADYFYLWDLAEAEALAGQWFGGYLTAKDWSEAWLDKGFAHYFNCLYTAHRNSRAEWLLWVHAPDQSSYFGAWNSGVRRPVVTKNYEDAATFINDGYATTRGSLVLNLLRKHLGEETWWKSIRLYVKTNGGKAVTTKDFQTAVEAASGEKMDWFFDQWIYKMGHPKFEVSKKYENGKLFVFVIQTQSIDKNNEYPQAEFFQGKIEIEIDGKIETVRLKPQTENDFTFNLPSAPQFVNFDFENSWIQELNYAQSFGELLAQFQNSKDYIARFAAMTELVRIAGEETTSAADKEKVFEALKKTVLSDSYWRLRNSAMIQLAALKPTGEATIATLLSVVKNDKSWIKASAIGLLGNTKDAKYTDLYINALNDESFRVINAAAVALGKTKSPKAFDILVKLKDKPSMKSQSLLCALAGLRALGDSRGFDVAFAALSDANLLRWRLSSIPPGWDFRDSAAATIKSLGKSEKAYPLIFERFKKSMSENDLNGIFSNVLLIITLADARGQEAFEMLKTKFKDDAGAMTAIDNYEAQFKEAIKKSL